MATAIILNGDGLISLPSAMVRKAIEDRDATIARLQRELAEARGETERWKEAYRCVSRELNLVVPDNDRLKAERDKAEAERDALIGAAYEAASKICDREYAAEQESIATRMWPIRPNLDHIADEIRNEAPTDATAALAAVRAEAELVGWKRGRDDAAVVAKNAGLAFGYERAVQAIRALTPPADLLERTKEGGK